MEGTVSKEAIFLASPPHCYLHLKPRWPPVAVTSEVNTLSPTPGNRLFSLIPDLWIHGVSLNDLKKKIGDSELSKSLVARVYRRKILRIAIEGQRKKWNPPLSCVICTFFSHLFRLRMTFFSFIYLYLEL